MKRKTLIGGALVLGLLGAMQTSVAFAAGSHDEHKQPSTSSQGLDSKSAPKPHNSSRSQMNHGDMDHGSMDHESMDHSGMNHDKMSPDPKAADAEVDSNHAH
ncbi:hypothetical protein MST27_21715 [Pseudomonas sp. PS1]|nr:hypothetical protein [Pseudomonas marianensis]